MFTHPAKVCMTYFQHCKFSLKLCFLFLKGAFFAFIHSFIPDLFITSSTNINFTIKKLISESGCRNSEN